MKPKPKPPKKRTAKAKPKAKREPLRKRPPRGNQNQGAFVGLSFSVPAELEIPLNAAAALRGMNRSAYLVWLVRRDLRAVPGLPEPPRAPIRVKERE